MDEKIIITESPNLKSLNTNTMDSIKSSIGSNQNEMSTNTKSIVASSAGFFSNFSWSKILLIFILLSFMGINIFSSLAEVSDWIGNTFGPIFRKFLGLIGMTTVKVSEKAVDVTASGAKTGIDIVSGTLDSGLDVIEGQLKNAKQSSDAKASTGTGSESNGALNTALAEALPQIPEPDDATSNTQSNRTGKAGFCYIGEDRGFRSCIEVKENDKCMSGQIFPSSAICVNPNLRE
jgi:hypothetical protein